MRVGSRACLKEHSWRGLVGLRMKVGLGRSLTRHAGERAVMSGNGDVRTGNGRDEGKDASLVGMGWLESMAGGRRDGDEGRMGRSMEEEGGRRRYRDLKACQGRVGRESRGCQTRT